MGKDHGFTCTRGQTDDLALHPTQGRRFNGGEGITLVGAELDRDLTSSTLHMVPFYVSMRRAHKVLNVVFVYYSSGMSCFDHLT
jgi:hypothetical protein